MAHLLQRLQRDRERLRRQIDRITAELAEVERAIAAIAGTALPECEQSGSIGPMPPSASVRLNHSRGSRLKTGNKNPLAIAADKAGHTVRSLAKAVGCSAPLLSQARAGVRSISLDLAQKIESVTGFEATKANWPQLRTDD